MDWWTTKRSVSIQPQFDRLSINNSLPIVYGDAKRYNTLQQVKNAFNHPNFLAARNATNPYEDIGKLFFINRAAVKLANIDAVFDVSGYQKDSTKALKFCDIAAGPGGFTQYLQYRFPSSYGYGMTLRGSLDWNSTLDFSRFEKIYGSDDSGNLYTNWKDFYFHVVGKEPYGVDLITADGGIDLEESNDTTLYAKQEFLSSRLLLIQCLIGILLTKVGGNFVVKVFDTVTEISGHTLFALSQCFEKMIIYKPVTSRPANAERYVICINRLSDVSEIGNLLVSAADSYSDTEYLTRLFSGKLPEDFVIWLNKSNDASTNSQLVAAKNILLYLANRPIDGPKYNLEDFSRQWNLNK